MNESRRETVAYARIDPDSFDRRKPGVLGE
jgi:hypothetical protein